MRITALELSAVGKTTVKSPDVAVTVPPKSNTAIALFDCDELYRIAPSAEIVRFVNTSSVKSTKAVLPDSVIVAPSRT